jgi:hypothetical protein
MHGDEYRIIYFNIKGVFVFIIFLGGFIKTRTYIVSKKKKIIHILYYTKTESKKQKPKKS